MSYTNLTTVCLGISGYALKLLIDNNAVLSLILEGLSIMWKKLLREVFSVKEGVKNEKLLK